MARSMIKRRQEAERQRIEIYEASLRRISSASRPPPDFDKALIEARQGFEGDIIRAAWAWRPRLKTRDGARLRLAAARHLFARYPVPAHLEQIWLDSEGLAAAEIRLRKGWYVTAARGGSLYRTEAGEWLSRKEVHWFLNPPGELAFGEAFWVAIARTYTDDLGIALRIAHSRIASTPREELRFWREVARFFCANPARRETMDDLCDYLAAARRRDPAFSLKGRTIASLTRLMEAWHRDLAAVERIEAMRRRAAGAAAPVAAPATPGPERRDAWPGSPLRDWEWRTPAREASCRGERFTVKQLKTAGDLVAESRAMHHCVSSYAGKCIAGYASIWSLRRVLPTRTEPLLTIELDRHHRAVQVRGFANRLASPEEAKLLARWARANGVDLNGAG